MRDSQKNKTRIYYALRNVASEVDRWGNTKDATTYGDPVELKISVSANKGEASTQAFGADLQYDREMVTHDMSCPIDEYTHLWIDEILLLKDNIGSNESSIKINMPGIVVEPIGDVLRIKSKALIAKGVGDTIVVSFNSYNYKVVAVSKSLNCIRYAIKRVNVSK